MKKLFNKKTVLVTSVVLLTLITVGMTVATVFTNTDPVENEFNPTYVACAVVENTNAPVSGDVILTGSTKNNVKIQNTGDTDAYIRVAVLANWASEDGSRVWAEAPVLGTDYVMSPDFTNFTNPTNGWIDGNDGFYYYTEPVSPSLFTKILINEARLADGVTPPTGVDGTKYYLSIEIVASAIQSTPTRIVKEQWGVTVAEDGTISKN